MREVILVLVTALTALQGSPDFTVFLHPIQELEPTTAQPRERICLHLCCIVNSGQENRDVYVRSTSSLEQCITVFTETCSDVCSRVCCVNIHGAVSPLMGGNSIVDQQSCLKHTCEMTDMGLQWKQSAVECVKCTSFINIPGQCCPHCTGPNSPMAMEPGEWGEWSECSVTCGGGMQSAVRECYEGETDPALHCPVPTLRTRRCREQPCPIACEWEWGEYGDCTESCGGGIKTRYSVIIVSPQFGGEPCPNNISESALCNNFSCPAPCEWEWGEYGTCSTSCGAGVRHRFPIITKMQESGGKPCPDRVINNEPQETACHINPCPAPCEWVWSEMSECTVSCNGGTQYRYPILTQAPVYGGRPCPDYIKYNISEKYQCNKQPCPIACWWKWSAFSDCRARCVGGRSLGRERYPVIMQQPLLGGTPCPDHVQRNKSDEMECHDEACSGKACQSGQSVCEGKCVPDLDQDCIPDNKDNCPRDPDEFQADSDGDMVGDECDNCPHTHNPSQADSDSDGHGNACDNCPYTFNPGQENRDYDAVGDVCDNCVSKYSGKHRDQDRDGVGDVCDNCPFLYNPDQEDRDKDYVGYPCEADKDTDGVVNQNDNCFLLYNPQQYDRDGDGYGDACDNCPFVPNEKQRDSDQDGFGDACDNHDDSMQEDKPEEDDTPLQNPQSTETMEPGKESSDELHREEDQPVLPTSTVLPHDNEELAITKQRADTHCG